MEIIITEERNIITLKYQKLLQNHNCNNWKTFLLVGVPFVANDRVPNEGSHQENPANSSWIGSNGSSGAAATTSAASTAIYIDGHHSSSANHAARQTGQAVQAQGPQRRFGGGAGRRLLSERICRHVRSD